jgi:hypothetical protein
VVKQTAEEVFSLFFTISLISSHFSGILRIKFVGLAVDTLGRANLQTF